MTQLLPVDDLFTENATHYGQKLAGYMRLRPWTVDGGTGFIIPTAVGQLHSGYFGLLSGSPQQLSVNQSPAAFTTAGGTSTAGDLCACLWRPYYSLRHTSSLTFTTIVTTGIYADTFRYAGVTVRNTGGTYDDTDGIESVTSGSGYWFLLAAVGGNAKWLLVRVNAGTVTLLASSAFFALTVGAAGKLRTMNLTVTDSGSTTVLTATYESANDAVGINGTRGATNPFGAAVVDSSGSRLSAAGRAGFGMSHERVQASPTIRSATLAHAFQITDTDTGAAVLRDEFQRAVLLGCALTTGELNGKNGRNLLSMWGNDTAAGNFYRTKRDAGNNRLLIDHATAAITEMWSQRAASHSATQRRNIRCNFGVGATTRYVGIRLRGTNFWDTLTRKSYQATLAFNSGGTWDLIVYWHTTNYFIAATKTGLTGLAVDTDIKLDFDIANAGGADAFTGEPNLIVRVNDVAVTGWTGLLSGFEALANGTLIDHRSTRILTGLEQCIEVRTPASTHPVRVDTWTDVPAAAVDFGESTHLSIAVSSEVTGKTGTLSLSHSRVIKKEKRIRAVRHPFDSRHVGRLLMDTRERRVWTVRSRAASVAENVAFLAFVDSHKAAEIPFTWVTDEGESVAAAFVKDRFKTPLKGPGVHEFEFELEERFAP